MEIRRTDLTEGQVLELLDLHTREMDEASPAGTCHVLGLSGLQHPSIEAFAAWEGEALLAIGALKSHRDFAEIKSMRAHPDARGKGAGKAMLTSLIKRARTLGFLQVKLETGSGALFEAAVSLYKSFGFEPCEPFGGYVPGQFNKLYSLDIQ